MPHRLSVSIPSATATRVGAAAVLGLLAALHFTAAVADEYAWPAEGSDFIGTPGEAIADHDDTLIDIARRHGFGYEEIVNANRDIDPWLPGEGTAVTLPRQRLLPMAPREGIVINLPEHRLYYFPPAKRGEAQRVISYPVSIGKMDWNTPLGLTKIVAKTKNPTWTPPASVRAEHAKRGEILPAVVPAGPDNPMGLYAMRLGIPGGAYLIHGTNRPAGVGMQVTHGCMRLYPEDIEALFQMVPVNTPVRIVNQPFKWGWHDGALYVEVHPPLEEDAATAPGLTELAGLIAEANRERLLPVDWTQAEQAYRGATGLPARVTIDRTSEFVVNAAN